VETIGFIGSGNMAEALINGVLKAGVYRPGKVYVSDIRPQRVEYLREHYGVRTAANNADLASKVDIVVLSVKPQNMAVALEEIKGRTHGEVLVISIAAGIKTSRVASVLGDVAVVRVMPNMPAWVKEGASVLYGKAIVVEDEKLLDPVTAVSGSGPAYFFLLMQEMIQAGVDMGLAEGDATELVLQTAKGAAVLAQKAADEGETPAQLSARVATPNGTTEAAFKVFQARGFSDMISAGLHRAAERSRELSGG
jgi:pyrroline-5-carboxylate reductase